MAERIRHAPPPRAGEDLRERAATVGLALADSLNALLASLPGAPALRPKGLATILEQTVATMSRLLKALRNADPLAVALHIPGPDPLSRIVDAARVNGCPSATLGPAMNAVELWDELIRDYAGDRSTLNSILLAWLPDSRREFELRRRQAVFKATSELKGMSCGVELDAKLLHPSPGGEAVDVVVVSGAFGMERIRPDAMVKFETVSVQDKDGRHPTNLDGVSVTDGLDATRLDQFCHALPAPMRTRAFGGKVQYMLGEGGFGTRFDLVLAEVNRSELPRHPKFAEGRRPYFFDVVDRPTKKLVLDLFVHQDLAAYRDPELFVYDTAGTGLARPGDVEREIDLVDTLEQIQPLGTGAGAAWVPEIPTYGALLGHVHKKLDWDPDEFFGYRVEMEFPLLATQLCLAVRS